MEFIQWQSKYELGIEQIDLHHKNLVSYINQLHDFISRGPSLPRSEIQDLLTSLSNYAVYHFDTEEDLMERHSYNGFESHKKQHDSFKEIIVKFLEQFDNEVLKPEEIAEFLKLWLLNHIAKEDTALTPYLKSQGVL